MDLSFLDAREQAEVKYCLEYVKNYNHGTDGHLPRTVIAKLATQLDKLQQEIRLQQDDVYMD